ISVQRKSKSPARRRGFSIRTRLVEALELEPELELDVALRSGVGAGHLAEVPRAHTVADGAAILQVPIRSRELRRVADVGRLGAELHPKPLGDREVLEDVEVE